MLNGSFCYILHQLPSFSDVPRKDVAITVIGSCFISWRHGIVHVFFRFFLQCPCTPTTPPPPPAVTWPSHFFLHFLSCPFQRLQSTSAIAYFRLAAFSYQELSIYYLLYESALCNTAIITPMRFVLSNTLGGLAPKNCGRRSFGPNKTGPH